MIFQDPYASLNPRIRVDAIVAEPIRAFDLIQGERDIQARVGELLNLVGLHAHQPRRHLTAVFDDCLGLLVGHFAVQAAPLDVAVHRRNHRDCERAV